MNTESYSEVITKIDSLMQKNPVELRNTAIEYFSLNMGAERYNNVYKSMTNNF